MSISLPSSKKTLRIASTAIPHLMGDHQHSSLALGAIKRIDGNAGLRDARGQGFELRTDGHGVARAAEGMLISTEASASSRTSTSR